MKTKKVIVFCQAAADVIYTLDLLDKTKSKDFTIVVRNVKSNLSLFKDLDIKAKVLFIDNVQLNIYSLMSIIKAKKEIQCQIRRFEKITKAKVYFFSTSYDYLTAAIIRKMSECNQVIYLNHYDHLTWLQASYSFSFKRKLASWVYFYLTQTKFSSDKEVNFPKFEYANYNIQRMDLTSKPAVNNQFLIGPRLKGNYILLFLSPPEYESLTELSKIKLFDLIGTLKKKYGFYFKGHPRLGEPIDVANLAENKFDKSFPSELIDYQKFSFVLGLTSAALCYPAAKRLCTVISLLEYLNLKDKSRKDGFKEYIDAYSNNNIIYDIETVKGI